MSVAIIQTGGKQYLVREGDELTIERVTAEPDSQLEFSDLLHGKTVTTKVVRHDRAEKVRVIKYKAKVRYLRRHGHRQNHTRLRIETIK